MNTYIAYTKMWNDNRSHILTHLKDKQYSRVIDIGASANSWAKDYMTHYFDINESTEQTKAIGFAGNICHYDSWLQVLEDVKINGKFDFAICTHTLEDICNPDLVVKMITKISKRGFNAVPSKYIEMCRHESSWRGWVHHRWIYNKQGNDIVAYPKLNLIDHLNDMDQLVNKRTVDNEELQWCWQDECTLKFVNNDYLGPDLQSVLSYYHELLND